MLISFILLLLLTWMLVDGKDLQDKLNQGQEALEQEREFRGQFTAEQQSLMLTYRDSLPEIDKHRDSIRHVIEKSATKQQIERGLELEERFGTLNPDLMTDRLRLMEKDRLRTLLESVQHLPDNLLLKLVDLASTEKLAARIQNSETFEQEQEKTHRLQAEKDRIENLYAQQAKRLMEFEQTVKLLHVEIEQGEKLRTDQEKRIHESEQKLLRLQSEKDRIENLYAQQAKQLIDFEQEAQTLYFEIERIEKLRADQAKRLQVSEQTIQRLQAEKDQIENSRKWIERSGADVARQLQERAGDKIKELGGRILDSGDVVFPESVLFETGSAEIRSEFDTLLREFCRPWFETLYNEERYIETMRIEGHASSEFGSLSPRAAFDANLDISQLRASAVLKRCIHYGGNDNVSDWARFRMAAIGFSSARPVIQNGVENRKASRRVVFSFDMKSADEVVINSNGQ